MTESIISYGLFNPCREGRRLFQALVAILNTTIYARALLYNEQNLSFKISIQIY